MNEKLGRIKIEKLRNEGGKPIQMLNQKLRDSEVVQVEVEVVQKQFKQ